MHKLAAVTATFVCATALSVATVSASPARLELRGFAGYNALSSQIELGNSFFTDQVPESGFLVGASVAYLVLPSVAPSTLPQAQLAVEAETKLTFSTLPGDDVVARSSYSAKIIGYRGHARLSLFADRMIVPFAVAGVGGEAVYSESPYASNGDGDAKLYWGVGAMSGKRQHGLRLDLRHNISAGRTQQVSHNFEFLAGYFIRFGDPERAAAPARDAEPVAATTPADETDKTDKTDAPGATTEPATTAPAPAATATPPAPTATPPAATATIGDMDNDGIPDDKDLCPKLAEVHNGVEDTDGCPEVDSDEDGLLGARDRCPDAAEDKDGFEDDDGCPDADNDGDGRPDTLDRCPLKAETFNGFEDDDGCPDVLPPSLAEFMGPLYGIRFRSSNATILPQTFPVLDRAVAMLKKHPSVRLRISGHTDNRGNDAFNLALSRKRADRVKWYLVDRGIDKGRLETVGYGSSMPKEDNGTRAGRMVNRRIEFEILTTKTP